MIRILIFVFLLVSIGALFLVAEEDLRRIEKDRREINAAYDNGYLNESLGDGTTASQRNGSVRSNDSTSFSEEFQDRIDKYGFIQNSKLPPQLTLVEQRRNNVEKQRELKWKSMLMSWPKHYSSQKQKYSEKLVSRIFKGIPNSIRNAAWYKLLDVESQIKAQHGVYEKMKNLARNYSLELRQIDLDINRTFRNNYAYRKRYCPRQRQLYNVLAAYSVYNTEVGYCQGMSTVAALLLMYLSDEERTFWALSQLMSHTKYSMHGFFKAGFPKLLRFSDKHEQIIKQLLPKVHKKFTKCNITPLIYTTKWFLQCYLDALPFSLALRVWDVYLLKGEIAMLAMSYCILNMHKRTLLRKDMDMDKINELLNHQLPQSFAYEDDLVMEKLSRCIEKLTNLKLDPSVDPTPANELPQVPFGSFKPSSGLLLLQQQSIAKTPADEQLRALADADQQKRKQQQVVNGGSLSDSDGLDMDEDDEDGGGGDDSDSDDLNPSKLSEYDDDKCDKESMISQMTMSSASAKGANGAAGAESISSSIENGRKYNSTRSGTSEKPRAAVNRTPSYYLNQTNEYENIKKSSSKSGSIQPLVSTTIYNSSSLHFQPSSSSQHQQQQSAAYTGTLSDSPVQKASSSNQRIPNSHTSIPVTASATSQQHQQPPVGTVSIMSNYYPPRVSYTTSSTGRSATSGDAAATSGAIASIRTNPDYYYNHSPPASASGVSSSRSQFYYGPSSPPPKTSSSSVKLKMSEYVRGPFGIYTRAAAAAANHHHDHSSSSASSQLPPSSSSMSFVASRIGRMGSLSSAVPQSTSTVQISSNGSGVTKMGTGSSGQATHHHHHHYPHINHQNPGPQAPTKRTASLRSIQKTLVNQHSEPLPYSEIRTTSQYYPSSPPPTTTSQTSNSYLFTPTKVQLENHSLRIASIQQQNSNYNSHHNPYYHQNGGSSMTVISQAPNGSNGSNPRPKLVPQSATTQLVQQRFVAIELNPNQTSSTSARKSINGKHDLIEQYDYI